MDAIHKQTFLTCILAFSLLSTAALADNAEDMARANDFYDKQEMMDAAVIFKKLALQNYVPAQKRLGDLLDYTEAHEEAVGWYILAAFQGDAGGAYQLGKAYLTGIGIKKDTAQALYWFKFAADKDDLNAVKVMENAYRKGAASGLNVPEDPKQAEFWNAKKVPLEAADKKEWEDKLAAARKILKEKAEATRKADEEAAKKPR